MSDIFKKYERHTFVATEDDLKSITAATQKETTQQAETHPVQFKKAEVVDVPKSNNDLQTDYNYIRTNLYTITEQSIAALSNLVQIADQSQHPRAYEVVSLLVNTIANAQKDLMSIHQQKAKIEAVEKKASGSVVNNNLFVGNTAQLDEIIKKMTKKSDSDE